MAVQILLGVPLEMAHKWWRVLLVYFCGVLAGSLGSSIMDPMVYLAGASGGVYALITAHIGTIIMVRRKFIKSNLWSDGLKLKGYEKNKENI